MKTRSFLMHVLLLSIVFFFFLLPPLLQTSGQTLDFSGDVQLPRIFFQAVCAIAVLCAAKKCYGISFLRRTEACPCKNRKQLLLKTAVDFGAAVGACGALCVCAALLQLASLYLGSGKTDAQVIMPDSAGSWLFCTMTFLVAAFYEEVLYRAFLPETVTSLLSAGILRNPNRFYEKQRFCIFTAELFSAAIFALSHRYLGILAVINAAGGHIILRVCFKKAQSIAPGCAAHFFYNILNLLLLHAASASV